VDRDEDSVDDSLDLEADTPRGRLLQAFEMFEFGVEMMAAKLRRQHPHASSPQIEALLEAWLAERPEASASDDDRSPGPR